MAWVGRGPTCDPPGVARFGIQLADFRSPEGGDGLFERASAAAVAAEAAGWPGSPSTWTRGSTC